MENPAEVLPLRLELDTASMQRSLSELQSVGQIVSRNFGTAFKDLVFHGKKFDEVMSSLLKRLSSDVFDLAMKPFQNALSGLFSAGGSAMSPGVAGSAPLQGLFPFAKGGVVASPTPFQFAGSRIGVAGEAGPEAIVPLKRGGDGRLGVAMQGGGASSVTINIATPDVEGFRRSETQVAAAVSRMMGQGRRNL